VNGSTLTNHISFIWKRLGRKTWDRRIQWLGGLHLKSALLVQLRSVPVTFNIGPHHESGGLSLASEQSSGFDLQQVDVMRFMVDSVVLGQIYGGQCCTRTDLWWTVLYWDRFMVDSVVLGQIYGGQCCTGTDLWWTVLYWDRFFSDYLNFPLSLFHLCLRLILLSITNTI